MFKIEARAGIAAPIDDVYELLADIDSWPTWSPIHKAASGKLSFGAPFHSEEQFEGLGVWEIDGVIADWTPLSHIHIHVPKKFYEGTLTRYYELEALSGKGTVFSVGAAFNGFLSEREGRRYAKFLKPGFEQMVEGLKAKAEAKFAENPDRLTNYDPPVTPPKSFAPPPKKAPPWAPPKRWKIGVK